MVTGEKNHHTVKPQGPYLQQLETNNCDQNRWLAWLKLHVKSIDHKFGCHIWFSSSYHFPQALKLANSLYILFINVNAQWTSTQLLKEKTKKMVALTSHRMAGSYSKMVASDGKHSSNWWRRGQQVTIKRLLLRPCTSHNPVSLYQIADKFPLPMQVICKYDYC